MGKKLAETLTNDQLTFWAANTDLNKEEIQAWYKDFQQMSLKSENLNKEMFVKLFTKLQPKGGKKADDFYALTFQAFDKDDSGTVDFQEFIVAFNIAGNGDVAARLGFMFDVYDQNDDKSIDRKEMELIVKAILKMKKKDLVGDQTLATKIDELFEKMDDNDNHKICKKEFVTNCEGNIFLRETLAPELNK